MRRHHAFDQAKSAGHKHDRGRGRATVIGGGVLGVELAASLSQMGLAVDLLVAQAQPWALNVFFCQFEGWWDRGGFRSRDATISSFPIR